MGTSGQAETRRQPQLVPMGAQKRRALPGYTFTNTAVRRERSDSIYCRYRVDIDSASRETGISSAIITAVIERESNGRNIIGDSGHGHGLMQIDDRTPAYRKWLERHQRGLDPRTNIEKGALILQENVRRFGNDMKSALAAFNAGPARVALLVRQRIDPDFATTGKNYGKDILNRAMKWRDEIDNVSCSE